MAIQQRTSGIFARAQSLVDSAVSPATRERFYSNANTFAHEQPLLAVRSSQSTLFPDYRIAANGAPS